ncbi:hypothetical protein DL770_010069 [Monosporascus sp. CRB-9-2]|nr:hypothetical protein DL770_010069 [Monosporascus sp. CRB-9-2]
MAENWNDIKDDHKRVLIVGAGAAVLLHLPPHVHHARRYGFHVNPVHFQVSSGRGETFWNNEFSTKLLTHHQNEVKRLVMVLKPIRLFEVSFTLLPIKLVFKLFMFSEEFTNSIALPTTALILGTGNATPEVPAMMLERLCTSPSYGMWYPTSRNTLVDHRLPMIVFPNFCGFYETWRKDLVSRGVTVRFSTELTEVVLRNKHGMATPPRHSWDELPPGRRRRSWDPLSFSDDITITHSDSDYMKKHYENFYREDLAVGKLDGVDQTSRLSFATGSYRPMYCIKMYPEDKSKLEMCFGTTNYQCQFPEKVSFEQHVFQTIYLNKDRDRKLWSGHETREDRIIRKDWWHQLWHSYTHYLFVAVISGIAAAVDLGAEYPEDMEYDGFAFLCFRLYYLLANGKRYRRKYTKNQRQVTTKAAKAGGSWATGVHGSVYKGPGVAAVERRT